MDDPPLCKKCLQADRKTKLCLYHISVHEGMYMCPVKKCFFPLMMGKEISNYIVPYEANVFDPELSDFEDELQESKLDCVETVNSNLNTSRVVPLNLNECVKTFSLSSVSEINLAYPTSHLELTAKHGKQNSSQSINRCLPGKEQRDSNVRSGSLGQTKNVKDEVNETGLWSSAGQIGVPVLEHSDTKRKAPACLDAADSSYIFPVWNDTLSVSWLDASIALLVCNKKLKDIITSSSVKSHLKKFCHVYNDALCRLNTNTLDVSKDRYQLPLSTLLSIKKELKYAQEEIYDFLQLNMDPGNKDLPVLAIENLLKEDTMIRNNVLVNYGWDMTCWSCAACIKERKQSTVLKLLDGCPDFSSDYPYYEQSCPTCKTKEQKMFFHFIPPLPKTVFLYFGAGTSTLNAADLRNISANRKHYQVTGILQYVVESSHYIAWIRNPVDSSWLCFDDWGPAYQQYSYEAPQIPGNEISLVMLEQDENASKTSGRIGGIVSINEYMARLKSIYSTKNFLKYKDKMCKTVFSNSNLQASNRAFVDSKAMTSFEKKIDSTVHRTEKISPNKDILVNKENFQCGRAMSWHSVRRAPRFNKGNLRNPSLSVLGHAPENSGLGKLGTNEATASSDYSSSNCKTPSAVRKVGEKLNEQSSAETYSCGEQEYECPPILQAVGMIRKSDYEKVVAKQSKSQKTQCFSPLSESSPADGLFPFQNVCLSKSRTATKRKAKYNGAPQAKKAKASSDAVIAIKLDKKTTKPNKKTTKPNKKTATVEKKPCAEGDIHSCPEAIVEVEVSTCNNIMDVENSQPSFHNPVRKKKNKDSSKTKRGKKQKNKKGMEANHKQTVSQKRGRRRMKTSDCEEGKDTENFESSSQSSEEHLIERYKLFTPLNFNSSSSEYLIPSANNLSIVDQSVDSFNIPVESVPVPSPATIPKENVDSESSEDLAELKKSAKNYSQKYKRM